MRKTYRVTEYGSFVRDKEVAGYSSLPQDTFDALENFVLSNSSDDADALELMGISARKGVGKIITAKNYVGVITMDDGTSIEILPKIFSHEDITEGKVKKLLIDMLKTLRNVPFKSLQSTNVDIEKLSIIEIFIRMFVDEVLFIVKRGLKCDYETIQSNETVFRGKLVFAGQIKHNYVHKERSFVEYDVFNTNRAENRILKSTLNYLYKHTTSARNKADIKTLLNAFSEVDESTDYQSDFARIVPDRKTTDYQTALLWSKVFLMGKSFTSFSGSEVAFALLFPMETLFESYIAAQLKKIVGPEYTLSAQDKSYHLFDKPRRFLMKPDIVIKRRDSDRIFVMDTKWKVLSDAKVNYGISQADMYQMYAYQKKYTSENVTLLYPLTDSVQTTNNIEFIANDGTVIRIRFVDLFNLKASLGAIVPEMKTETAFCAKMPE